MKLLLEKGADVESKDSVWPDAAIRGRRRAEAVVKLLLEKGADVESKDDDGETPLSLAAEKGMRRL